MARIKKTNPEQKPEQKETKKSAGRKVLAGVGIALASFVGIFALARHQSNDSK